MAQRSPVFTTTSSIVTVPCSVTNASGVPVTDLAAEDFELYVDGVRHRIDHVWTDPDRPLLLGVVNDISLSQAARTGERDREIQELLEQLIHANDRAFVVSVNERVLLQSEVMRGEFGLRNVFLPVQGTPLGPQCGEAVGGDGRLHAACGGTALWNAIYASARLKLTSPSANQVLLVLSDGNDTGSTRSFTESLAELKRSGAAVYAVIYPDEMGVAPSDELQQMAGETGGASFALQGKSLASALSSIAAGIQARYILGFVPDSGAADGKVHTIRVTVRRNGVVIRARAEYTSQ
ncbi:MAG TPA: VWA domain-containing protein [Bryobacteraceae bacterium]|nr:VWA domain-containing protein [Bryobacteraceae bacterium]